MLCYSEYKCRNNTAAREAYILAPYELIALICPKFGLNPEMIWVPSFSAIIHPPPLLQYPLAPSDDIMRGTSVYKWWIRGSVLILCFVFRVSYCIHSGLDDKYSSQLFGMGDCFVGILWLIWILNVNLVLVDSTWKLSRDMVELWSSVSKIICIFRRIILDANHCS